MSASYRLMQGVRALFAFTRDVDYTLVERVLTPAQVAAFKRMTHGEQLHSLRVLEAVLHQQPDTPHDLQVAALLHDCGKARWPLSVYGKSIAVLARKLAPPLYHYGSRRDPARAVWARPFIVAEQHPAWGAEILRETGGTTRAVWLVEHHQDNVAALMEHPHAGLLWRLQQADDRN